MQTPQLTRRRSIALGTTTIAGLAGLTLATGDSRAQAAVSIATKEAVMKPQDGEVYAPHVRVRGSWSFSGLSETPDSWAAYLQVGDGSGGTEAIGLHEGSITNQSGSGSFSVRGPVTAASFYSPDTFSAEPGSPTTVDVPLEVLFLVQGSSGTLVSAMATGTQTIRVEYGGSVASIADATATAAMQDDQGDPEPDFDGGA